MENTPQQKKTNWGIIILLVVLIPVVLLGYKYISKIIDGEDNAVQNDPIQPVDDNSATEQYAIFPLTGDWYYQDTDYGPKYAVEKYNFTAPQIVNGILKGQMTLTIEWMESVQILKYEVIHENKLRISPPDNSPFEIDYVYSPQSQTLEISDQGYRLTYTRNPDKTTVPND